jgi:acyl-CoA thioester hydrolase
MTDKPVFQLSFTAAAEHIDELGHVNNAVWVQWIQQVAVAHWEAVAAPAHKDAFFWVVVRHEVDYLRAAHEGDQVTARTWVGDAPRGARFDRFIEFAGPDGKLCVRSRTDWAMIDRASGRPMRVPPEVIAPFVGRG